MPEIKDNNGSSNLIKNSDAGNQVKVRSDTAAKQVRSSERAADAVRDTASFVPRTSGYTRQREKSVPENGERQSLRDLHSKNRSETQNHVSEKTGERGNRTPNEQKLKYRPHTVRRTSSGSLQSTENSSNPMVRSTEANQSRLVKTAKQGNMVRTSSYSVKIPSSLVRYEEKKSETAMPNSSRSTRYKVTRINQRKASVSESSGYLLQTKARVTNDVRPSTEKMRHMVRISDDSTLTRRVKTDASLTFGIKRGIQEVVAGRGAESTDDQATGTLKNVRRSGVRAVGAVYGANKIKKKRAKEAAEKLKAEQEKYSTPKSSKLIKKEGKAAGRKAMTTSLKKSIIREGGDKLANIRSSGDNYATDGLVGAKNVTVGTYRSAKFTTRAVRRIIHTARAVTNKASMAAKAIAKAVKAVAQVVGKLAAGSPVILGILAIFIIIMVIMAIVPTFTLKSTDTSLTKIYKYCTNLDATFSEKVTNELSKDGYYRIDFYQNGAKSNGQSSWKTETDLDMLLAYYDAMFEDYSSGENEDEISEADTEIFDNSQDNDSDNTDESESYLKSNFKAVKKYSKNLWKHLYTLRVGTHTETITYTTSSGKTKERIVTILDVYVTTKTLMQMATLNAKDDDARDITYDNLLDIPFGYLTSSQQEVYDILQEVGTYTTLEEISNPFSLTSDTEQKSWSVSRRYGYYLHGGTKKENHGLLISAQSGAAVYAGVSGNISISENYVTIKSDSREVTYGPLTSIQVRSGNEISSGTQIGSASGTSLEITFKRNGKELNPLFYISGYARSGSGVGNGDIVATALAEVGTLETGVNNVKYNTWYYGTEVNGINYPWCAAFVAWCADQNGYIDAGIVPNAAYCGTFIDFYTAQGRFYRVDSGYVPVPGDFIMFSSSKYPNGTAHIGIVVSCDGTTVYTVEGNTSGGSGVESNGGGVFTKSYSLVQGTSTSDIWGFCNPAYPSFSTSDPPEGAELLGTFKITHYCPCAICNGSYVGQPTASGTELTEGRTIAVDSSVIPLGSQVFIEGYGLRTAEDTGSAIIGNKIDMYVSTHAEALELGVVYKKVYLVK